MVTATQENQKVALYARVSTDEQTEVNQTALLEQWARDRGWEVQGIYTDIGSAWTQKGDRAELNHLLTNCHRGLVKIVLVYDLSRLTRKGPEEMLKTLRRFADNGAQVYSYSEPWLNVPSEFHPVLVSLYGFFAELFSRQLSARTKAGMARARAQGVRLGRPKKRVRENKGPISPTSLPMEPIEEKAPFPNLSQREEIQRRISV